MTDTARSWIKQVKEFRTTLALEEERQEVPRPDQLAFCCLQCRCTEEEKDSEDYIISSNTGNETGLHHRSCCHNWENWNEDWVPPFYQTILKLGLQQEKGAVFYSKNEVKAKVGQAWREESQAINELSDVDPALKLYSDPKFLKFSRIFNETKEKAAQGRRAATVIEMFGGIGGGLVALKHLKIDIKIAIYVEHDDVAKHVYQYNHHHNYNPDIPNDGIRHIFEYRDFKDMAREIGSFMERFAPIDIIIGGPPCPDYSGINANKQGVTGSSGKYLPGKRVTHIFNSQFSLFLFKH